MADDLQAAQLRVIRAVDELARSFGAQAWLRGGWPLDFCLGRVTRLHTDVDVYTEAKGHQQIVDMPPLLVGHDIAAAPVDALVIWRSDHVDVGSCGQRGLEGGEASRVDGREQPFRSWCCHGAHR